MNRRSFFTHVAAAIAGAVGLSAAVKAEPETTGVKVSFEKRKIQMGVMPPGTRFVVHDLPTDSVMKGRYDDNGAIFIESFEYGGDRG
jgi:hypothetical protein